MLVDREKEWGSYKERWEIVIFEIFFGMVHGQPYEGYQKSPHVPISIVGH